MCLLVFAGCAVQVAPTPEPVTIAFSYASFGVDREPYEGFIQAFGERFPHITVEVRQWAPWVGVGAGEVDVIAVDGGLVPQLREEESIVSLDAFIQRDESFDLSALHPDSVAHLTHGGETWAIPAGLSVSAIYYNKDLFDRYGVPYPEFGWTWEDFAERAVALRDPGAGVYGYAAGDRGFDTIPFIYQHGGRIVDDLHDPTYVVFEDPLTVEALDWYARLAHEYDAVLTPEQSYKEFSTDDPRLAVLQGRVGMWMEDLSGASEIKSGVHFHDVRRTGGNERKGHVHSPEVWSEGLGWYALILVETLNLLPAAHPGRAQVMRILLDLIEGLRETQDAATGLWCQVVDKGDRADNWCDASGSAMFVYAIQRAIDLGYVSAAAYGPVVQRGYDGILSKAVINEDGLVDIYDACDGVCVQRSYADYVKKVNAKEAVGGVLWATTIVEKPVRRRQP